MAWALDGGQRLHILGVRTAGLNKVPQSRPHAREPGEAEYPATFLHYRPQLATRAVWSGLHSK